MTRNKRTAYGGPPEEKEVVLTLDRRLLWVVGLIAAFGLAVGGGMMFARMQSTSAPAAQAPAATSPEDALANLEPDVQVDEAAARATAAALGLNPDTVNIVDSNIAKPVAVTTLAPGLNVPDDSDSYRAQITPVDEIHEGLLEDPNSQVFEIPQDPTSQAALAERYKPEDVLANLEDPNVMNPDYSALRLETVSKSLEGPRLAISDLNLRNTYNFGVVPMDQRVSKVFTAKNVGDEDLLIGRVYTGCGCTATTIGDEVIPPDGFLATPLTLAPGEEIAFGIEYDASAEGRTGAMSKYIQIFTNDPTKAMFDETEPLSHETRFRIVVEPQYGAAPVPSDG